MFADSQFRRVSPLAATDWTLRQVFEGVFVVKRSITKTTRTGYGSSLTRWEMITGNPSMADLSDPSFDLQSFCDFVRDEIPKTRIDGKPGGLSIPSANKELRQLQAILSVCGPLELRNRDGQGFLPQVPLLRLFDEPDPTPRFLSLDELNAICEAARVARCRAKSGRGFHRRSGGKRRWSIYRIADRGPSIGWK